METGHFVKHVIFVWTAQQTVTIYYNKASDGSILFSPFCLFSSYSWERMDNVIKLHFTARHVLRVKHGMVLWRYY